ncbi:MAG: hypothetical protein KDB53_16655 [Planctomycetes bacterium]|nr:hypothetical protein [Planctomycetota bacterium]
MQTSCIREQAGSALLVSVIGVFLLMGFTVATMSVVNSHGKEHLSAYEGLRCMYIAELGIERANLDLNMQGDGNLGTQAAYVPLDYGEFWVTSVMNPDGSYLITSRARLNQVSKTVQAVTTTVQSVFHHALFAGNESQDPNYVLELGGVGQKADSVTGDVYSGQDLDVSGAAVISGEARVVGLATGTAATAVPPQPIPDIAGMAYATNHDVDVAAEFAGAVYASDDTGGTAWQLPATNPAHVFRKNPSNRTTETAGTTKDDYFLEDPYEPVGSDVGQDGSNPHWISFDTGAGATTIERVYYIDGNLWLHNYQTYSLRIRALANGSKVTLAVVGNIYISDNLFYGDPAQDGIALVAVKDPNVADSGNIYFGDPAFGTLEQMYGFMYAQNNFYDLNLGTAASRPIYLKGTMSAGNHVSIQRSKGNARTKLVIEHDTRIADGSLRIPGVPQQGGTVSRYAIRSWIRASGDDE